MEDAHAPGAAHSDVLDADRGVDQVQFEGAGIPRSIVLDDAALARAGELGRTVAEQAGRRFEDAEYRGEPGLCPHCHLDVVVLHGPQVECATCGARGVLESNGVRFSDEGSVITMREKREHFFEIQATAQRHAEQREEIERRASAYDGFDRFARPDRLAQ